MRTTVGVQSQRVCTFQARGMWLRNVRQTKQRYKSKKQRRRIELEGKHREYHICLCLFLMIFKYLDPKGGGGKRLLLHDTKNKIRVVTSSIPQNIKYLYPESVT